MLREGDLAAGRYRLQSLIGEGAMGEVWRAEDELLRRLVAVKFLFVRGARDPQSMVDQFLREARIAASVQHRNVIHTVDFGTVDETQPYMVMELLDGLSLADRMERNPPLNIESFVQLVGLTLRGLAAVHDAGIVHRDLKPANIFLQNDPDGVLPKILDFGISRSLHSDDRKSAISTQHGLIVGTPDYMAPEQARGEADVDKRADIYAMGAILYEGLTGQLPYPANNIGELIAAIVTTRPRPVRVVRPEVPELLALVVEQAMAHNRDERFLDARVMRNALLSAAAKCLPALRHLAVSLAPAAIGGAPAAGGLPPAPAASLDLGVAARAGGAFGGRSLDGRALDVPSPQAPREPLAVGGASAGGGWGGFEGLPPRASIPGGAGQEVAHAAHRAAAVRSGAGAAAGNVAQTHGAARPAATSTPAAGAGSAGGGLPLSLASGPPMEVPEAPSLVSARPKPLSSTRAAASDPAEFNLPGRARLDSLRAEPGNDQMLEIDYKRGTEHTRKKKPAGTVKRRAPVRSVRRRESAWPTLVLLVLVFGALGFGPALVLDLIGSRVDIGTAGSMESADQHLQFERRRSPGRHPPALRDLMPD